MPPSEHGAKAVAHGCTGKGNDQVRFDVTFQTLAPDLKIIAPVREWKMTRDEEIEFADEAQHPGRGDQGKPLQHRPEPLRPQLRGGRAGRSLGRAARRRLRLDRPIRRKAPNEPEYVEIEFEQGRPVGLNGKKMDGVPLIEQLNELGGKHGVGRIDHVENRLVGIKSRELYEAPAAVILHEAHRELEIAVPEQAGAAFQDAGRPGIRRPDLQWTLVQRLSPGPVRRSCASNQRFVTGLVRVKLFKGKATVVGRKSEHSLYSKKLATYETGDQFDHDAAKGFIRLHGLSQQTQAQRQFLKGG